MNQITTLGGGGRTRVAGSLDEPGQVSVGIVGQGDKPARMLSGNRFETELDLPSGTSTLQITAADGSANLTSKQYSVVTSPESSRTVTHDADGNMTSDGVRTYEWDVWSRLKKITWTTGKTTTFHYNALGERTKMVHVDAGVTRTEYFLYDGPRPIQRRSEGTATSNIDREYFSGGERRWNTGTGAWVNHHFTRDHLGSVREVLDSSGTLLARYDYAPYGERVVRYEASGYSSDIGFTGHFLLQSPVSGQSEILLAHYRAYDPVLGRWLSQDPIREVGGINLYGYVGGNVAWAIDPWGLETWDEWLVGALPGWAVDALGSSPEIPQGVQDFTAGMADSLSFGISKQIRKGMGTESMVDSCSDYYSGGQWTGAGLSLAAGGVYGAKAAGGIRNLPLYELGQKWLPRLSSRVGRLERWNKLDPVEKGRRILKAADGNWLKAFAPESVRAIFSPFSRKALGTGPTPFGTGGAHAVLQLWGQRFTRENCN